MKNIHIRTTLQLLIILFFYYSSSASAHVRWFAPEGLPPLTIPRDTTTMMLSIFVCVVVFLIISLRLLAYKIKWLNALFISEPSFPYKWLWYLLLGFINIFIVSNLLYGDFIAPNLSLPIEAVRLGVVLQAFVVILMPWSVSLVGVLFILIATIICMVFPFSVALDYLFEFISIGLALIFAGPSLNKNDRAILHKLKFNIEKSRAISVDFLRIGLGLQLIELAVQNKLMTPEAALWFINENSFYNFFQLIGINQVTNLHFVYFIGVSETVLGIMLLINFARRAALLALLIAFSSTALFSGGHELTGHLPIVGVILVLLTETSRFVTGEAAVRIFSSGRKLSY